MFPEVVKAMDCGVYIYSNGFVTDQQEELTRQNVLNIRVIQKVSITEVKLAI
jgi:hypothetical protein